MSDGELTRIFARFSSVVQAFLQILSTEGRGVRLCWAKSKPKGSKERNVQFKRTRLTRVGRVRIILLPGIDPFELLPKIDYFWFVLVDGPASGPQKQWIASFEGDPERLLKREKAFFRISLS